MLALISSIMPAAASAGFDFPKSTSWPYRLTMSGRFPAPTGGGSGVSPSSGLIWSRKAITFLSESFSSPSIASRTSVFGGTPRSVSPILPASIEFTMKSTNSTAASGLPDLAETDQNCDALYQSLVSLARPARLGSRSSLMSSPEALSNALTWFDQAKPKPSRPTAKADWSSDWPSSSATTLAGCPAPEFITSRLYSYHSVASASSKASPVAVNRPLPFCRRNALNAASLALSDPIPSEPFGVALVTAAATLIRSSQVQLASSGCSTPASLNTFGCSIATGALTPALIAIRPVSV